MGKRRRRECISIQDVSVESIVRERNVKIWDLHRKHHVVHIRIVTRHV